MQPHEPADYDEAIALAFKAQKAGVANEGQQLDVLAYIEYLTGTGAFDDIAYRPGAAEAERASAFADGKRFVGLQIKKLLNPLTHEALEVARQRQALMARDNARKRK